MKVVIVSEKFPPDSGIGCLRWGRFSQSLIERGHQVFVVAAGDGDSQEAHVLRSPMPLTAKNRLKRLLRRDGISPKPKTEVLGKSRATVVVRPTSKSEKAIRRVVSKFFYFVSFPNGTLNWGRSSFDGVVAPVSEFDPDLIIGSWPGLGALHLARQLGDKLGRPWIADYRDPFTDFYSNPIRIGGFFYRKLEQVERRLNDSAAAVITVNEQMSKITRVSDRSKIVEIPNCYEDGYNLGRKAPLLAGELKLVYTGVMARPAFLEPLFEALRDFSEHEVHFHYYGSSSSDVLALWQSIGCAKRGLTCHGLVSRPDAIEAQAGADLLVVSGASGTRASECVVTGKMMEYIQSGVPLLGISQTAGDAMDSLFTQTGVGVCFQNAPQISAFLRKFSSAKKRKEPYEFFPEIDHVELEKYSLSHCTSILEDVLERTVGAAV